MKRLIVILLFALFAGNVNGQADTATMRRLGLLDDTKAELIIKCRRHIADAVINGDRQKVAELYEYALTLEDDQYLPLLPREKWILDMFLFDFKEFIKETAAFDSIADIALAGKSMFNDNMYPVIYDNVARNTELEAIIESSSDLSQMEKDYLRLYLSQVSTQPVDQKQINKKCDVFLNQYPNSPYEYFLRRYVRYVYVKDFEKFQLDLGMGFGSGVLVGGISDWFESGGFGGTMDISFGIKKYEFQIQLNVLNTKSKKDIDLEGVNWEKGKGTIGNLQLNVGRYMPLTHNWVLIPRAGVGLVYVNPVYKKENKNEKHPLEGKELSSIPLPTIGAEIRYEKIFSGGYDIGYIGPVLRYSMQPILIKINGEKTFGVLNTITAVFKIGAGFPKREL